MESSSLGVVNTDGYKRIRDFQPINHCTSEMMQYRASVGASVTIEN